MAKLKFSSFFLYENKPNVVFPYSISDEVTNEILINSYGFRDDEFSRQKAADVFRIAVLGDSQEEALQVPLFDTWQKVMARKLSEELEKAAGPERPRSASETALRRPLARRVESYNFGVSGYGTDQEWLTLREKVWQFSPDMVILAFSPNDVGDTYKNKLVRIIDGRIGVASAKERTGGNILGRLVRQTYTYHLVIKASRGNLAAKIIIDGLRTKILGFPSDARFFLSDAQLIQGPFEVIASQKIHPRRYFPPGRL